MSNRMLRIFAFIFVSTLANVSLTATENGSSATTLNVETIHQISQLPIVFEGVTYQPDEYMKYFEDGLEIDLDLVPGKDAAENDILYAFRPSETDLEFINLNTETIHEIPHLPIMFEGVTYQPNEYIEYFENGWNIDVHLLPGRGEGGTDVYYALPYKDFSNNGLILSNIHTSSKGVRSYQNIHVPMALVWRRITRIYPTVIYPGGYVNTDDYWAVFVVPSYVRNALFVWASNEGNMAHIWWHSGLDGRISCSPSVCYVYLLTKHTNLDLKYYNAWSVYLFY